MKSFVVFFILRPAVRIEKKTKSFDFTFKKYDGDKRVIITPIEEKIDDQTVQTGLLFKAYVTAENINRAREQSKAFVDGVVGFLAFTTGVALSIPNEVLAYEITPSITEREFLQVFYNPANLTLSRRIIDQDFLKRLIEQFSKQGNESNRNMARALRWYRMATLTIDPFDKFGCFWTGLEALNPLLREKLGVTKEIKKIRCKNCGCEIPLEKQTVSGIKRFVSENMQNPELFKRLSAFRVYIVHSIRELSKMGEEAKELTPKLTEVLFRAICFVLDFKDWNSRKVSETLENITFRLEFEGNLIGDYSGGLGYDGNDPHIVLNQSSVKVLMDDKGEITFENKLEFIDKIAPFTGFRGYELRIYGDKETKAAITNMCLKSKNSQPSQ